LGVANVQTFAIDELLASRKTAMENHPKKRISKKAGWLEIQAFQLSEAGWLKRAAKMSRSQE